MCASIQIPDFLAPDESVRGIGAFRLLGVFELVDRFAREFQIDQEIAFASLLAGFAHSMGGAFEMDSALGKIRAPFSLLLVTPESDAVWSRAPVRFLVEDFETSMRIFAGLVLPKENKGEPDPEDTPAHPEATRVAKAAEMARSVYADKVSERLVTSSLVAPFLRAPFDHHVLLTNPHPGLGRAMRLLSSGEKIRLEQALSSSTPMRQGPEENSGGVPAFYWQVDRREARRFLGENPWFAGLPFLMLESAVPGVVALDPDKGCGGEIQRRCLDLFVSRHQAMRRPRFFSAKARPFEEVREFLAVAQRWENESATPSPVAPGRVAQTALRFALLFIVLDGKPEPDQVAAFMGLELAKRLHIRHLKTLAKFLPVPPSEVSVTEGLTDREQKVYFRICEQPGLSASELGRTFRRLRKPERDEVLTGLLRRGLVELKDGKLYRKETRGNHLAPDVPLPR